MAQNSRPRSDSSASNNKRKRHEYARAHSRSTRQVNTGTPRVLGGSGAPQSSSGQRSSGRSGGQSRSQNTRAGSSRANSTRASSSRAGSRASNGQAAAREARASSGAERRNAPKKRGIGFKLGIIAIILAVLLGGFIALYFSPLFGITDVQVAGNERIASEEIIERAAVSSDSTFLRTDTAGIKERLMSDPWVQEAEVERIFPGTLVLHVTERPIAAVVDIVPSSATASTERWAIAGDGTWLAQVGEDISEEEVVDVPKIKDVSAAVSPETGVVETDEGITNALTLLREFSDNMRLMVASISAANAEKTTLTLYNNVGVAFGVAEDIEAKEQAIATLLAEHEGTITYINVRSAEHASYRATE